MRSSWNFRFRSMSVRSFAYDSEQGEGGRTSSCDGGVWEPQHFGALNGAASAARDLQRPPRYHNLFGHHVSREGLQVSHMCSARLSTATITNCPKPRREVALLLDQLFPSSPVPLSECCMNFLSHAIAANKRRLVNGGRRSADLRYEIAKCETCQYYRARTMILSPD